MVSIHLPFKGCQAKVKGMKITDLSGQVWACNHDQEVKTPLYLDARKVEIISRVGKVLQMPERS